LPPQYRRNSTLFDFNEIAYVGRLWWPELISDIEKFLPVSIFWKWRPLQIFRWQESIQDIIIYLHMKCRWNRTMLNLCSIVAAILKMATGRNFSMSAITPGHPFSKWPLRYRTNSILSDFNDISYVGRLWCPELIPDIEQFLLVAIFKMATTIRLKFNIVRYHQNLICG
jgi:hypothetical protein